MTAAFEGSAAHTVAIVIPVYKGELVLGRLFDEIVALAPDAACAVTSPAGHPLAITEIVLVHDCGPDDSARVIRELAARDPRVRPVWLSRNFGQHSATLAGIATTSTEWVVTMDEDGQHDPADLPRLLDVALATGSQLVYARGANDAPHGWFRNTASAIVKWVADHLVAGEGMGDFSSYRLVLGEVGRAISAFGGHDVYLDVALTWVARPSQVCPVQLRSEDRASGYSTRGLIRHLGRLLLTSGVRPLRLITLFGSLVALAGFLFAGYAIVMRVMHGVVSEGWTSVIVAVLVMGGLVLVSLGIMAEYLAVVVGMAMGRPSFLLVGDPARGPLGRVGRRAPIGTLNDARPE
jgi:glycosyltransferase involved in cell wall biosynthesis